MLKNRRNSSKGDLRSFTERRRSKIIGGGSGFDDGEFEKSLQRRASMATTESASVTGSSTQPIPDQRKEVKKTLVQDISILGSEENGLVAAQTNEHSNRTDQPPEESIQKISKQSPSQQLPRAPSPSSTAWAKLAAWNRLSSPFFRRDKKKKAPTDSGSKSASTADDASPNRKSNAATKTNGGGGVTSVAAKPAFAYSPFLSFGSKIHIVESEICRLCGKKIPRVTIEVKVECRVCGNLQHLQCLQERMNYGNDEVSQSALTQVTDSVF